jgi:hypothetical protein
MVLQHFATLLYVSEKFNMAAINFYEYQILQISGKYATFNLT